MKLHDLCLHQFKENVVSSAAPVFSSYEALASSIQGSVPPRHCQDH